MIDLTIEKLIIAAPDTPYKRDGWIFQMITWIAINKDFSGTNFFCQIPHDAPAQHGIDGLGVLLSPTNTLKAIVIAEDKYTEKPRRMLYKEVWPELKNYEKGTYDNKIVNRVTGLLDRFDDSVIDALIQDDIYKKDFRNYRVGITPEAKHNSSLKKKKLFKGYSTSVKGKDHLRRIGVTFEQADIRQWMDDFSVKVIAFLKSKKS